MAKSATNLTARIRRLEAAKVRADKLPARQVLTFKPMSDLLGVSRQVLTGWADEIDGFETSGAFERGGNGIEWQFKPRKTVAFLLKHFRKAADKQSAKSRELSRSVGVRMADDDEALSMTEVKERVNLTLTVVAAAERQKLYTPTDEVRSVFDGYNQAVVDGIMGVRTKVDPNGNLPPHIRKQVDEYLRSVAAAVHASAQRYIEGINAGSEQAGVGRAR
ncbi:MAG: hypothetical protein IPG83_02360 [Novosphingobium sp.]|jgi:hypothetical protein|nr:hypothetical protein [Novosphingobium sp.]